MTMLYVLRNSYLSYTERYKISDQYWPGRGALVVHRYTYNKISKNFN